MLNLNPSNQFMTKSASKQPAPSPRPQQTCRGSKAVCTIWIWPTDNFLSHPRIRFGMNEHWFSEYNKKKSLINKRVPVQKAWRRFRIDKINKSMWTSLNTQPAPSSRHFKNLRGKKIRMYGLNTAHIQFANTPDKISGSMNANPITMNKQVNNQWQKDKN